MSTAIYYSSEERHSLPSLSSIMSNPQNSVSIASTNAGSISAASINGQDSELFSNAGSQPSTANTTPASSFSGKGSGSNYYNSEPQKCTCKSNANRIPRPRNAFILFRQKHHQSVLEEGSVIKTNPEVSRELGRRWRALSHEERDHWNKLAEEEKTNHAKRYPGYRYTPRRNGKGKLCDYCKQKALRQQQLQLHNQQLIQLQQDQYASYLLQQQQAAVQQMSLPNSANQQYNNYQTNSSNMLYIPQNSIQTNFQFQYNDFGGNQQEKLSPLTQVPLPYDPHYHHNNATALGTQPQQQPQQYAAIGYEQQRYNPLPTPVNSNLGNTYGFETYQS